MTYILSVVYVIVTLLETSNCLQCVHCQAYTFECSGSMKNCTENNAVCSSLFTQYSDGMLSVERGCALPTSCNQSFTMMLGNVKRKLSSSCCSTTGCTPTAPNKNMISNGITCPSCYIEGFNLCLQVDDIECSGNESKCFTYTLSTGSMRPIFARGCATEQLCSSTVGTIVPSNMQGGNLQCTEGCTGSCLRCIHCLKNSSECSGSLSSCTESNAVCASRFMQFSDDMTFVERGCAVPTYCNQSLTVPSANIKISSSCCNTEGCTPTVPSMNGNGVMCPSCYVQGSNQCPQVNSIECFGNETKCFTYSSSAGSASSYLLKGCTTEQLCSGTNGTIVPVELQGGNAQCTATTPVCGNCLRCMICQSNNGLDCSGSLNTCVSNEVCSSVFTQASDGKVTVGRGCAPLTFCDQSFTVFKGNTTIKISSSCCNTEGCKPLTPNMVGNGIKCPSCYAEGSTQCSQVTTIECTGYENKCFSYSLPLGSSSNQTFVRGCTTERLCSGTINTIIPTTLQGGEIQCTSVTSTNSAYTCKIDIILLLAFIMVITIF
ncbi:uncharacterized protein O3C94_001546 [Discoglossus pictus]